MHGSFVRTTTLVSSALCAVGGRAAWQQSGLAIVATRQGAGSEGGSKLMSLLVNLSRTRVREIIVNVGCLGGIWVNWLYAPE